MVNINRLAHHKNVAIKYPLQSIETFYYDRFNQYFRSRFSIPFTPSKNNYYE